MIGHFTVFGLGKKPFPAKLKEKQVNDPGPVVELPWQYWHSKYGTTKFLLLLHMEDVNPSLAGRKITEPCKCATCKRLSL